MKINENTLINIVQTKDYITHHTNFINNVKPKDIRNFLTYEKKINFFNATNTFRKLILSSNVINDIDNNYFCSKDIRYKVLKTLPNRTDSIMIDENTLLRYIKTDDEIICCFDYVGNNKKDNLFNFFFFIDLENETIKIDNYEYLTKDYISYEKFVDEFFSRFMLVVTYLELTPITTIILDSGKKVGTKKAGKYFNETNKRFILVTSDWNVEKIDLRDIHVRGHWRLQPCGIGRTQYKYVYIKPYEKGITRRLSQKELV